MFEAISLILSCILLTGLFDYFILQFSMLDLKNQSTALFPSNGGLFFKYYKD